MFNQNKIEKLRDRVYSLETDVMMLRADNKSLSDFRDKIEKLEKFLGVKRRDVLVPASKGFYLLSYSPASVGWEYVKKENKHG